MADQKRTNTTSSVKKTAVVRKKRRKISRFHLVVVLFISVLVLSGASAFMLLVMPGNQSAGTADKPAVFAVSEVRVEGDTRYSPEAIIGISGIHVGQSLFSVNKRQASENIRAAFPYIEYIEIGNASFDTIVITVREVEVIGARYAGGSWILVGSNNRALEALPMTGSRPGRHLYFKGVTPAECEVGGEAMDERSESIVERLLAAFQQSQVPDESGAQKTDFTTTIMDIDMTDKNDIQLNWNNRITIALGNELELEHKIAVAATTIPRVLSSYGENITGILNMRSYADDNMSVFTPQWVLDQQTQTTAPTTGTTVPAQE